MTGWVDVVFTEPLMAWRAPLRVKPCRARGKKRRARGQPASPTDR